MSRISQYSPNNSPDSAFLLIGTDPDNHSMAPTGTTETVPLNALVLPVAGMYNAVTMFGADPTGSTDSTAAIQNTITAAAASANGYGVVYLPAGTYLISGGWNIPSNVAFTGAADVGLSVTNVWGGTTLQLSGSFSGSYVFNISEVGNAATNGPVLRNFSVNGHGYTATAVDGIRLTGPVMTQIQYVTLSFMSGWGVNTFVDLSSTSDIGPFGQNWLNLTVDSCDSGGINLLYTEDSTFTNCYVIGINAGPGWQICAVDNSKFIGCRAEWCATYGFWFTDTGSDDWTYATGFCQMIGCSTDRNTFDGIRIDATWTTGGSSPTGPGGILISGQMNRRDGAANNGATGSYAGINIDATNLPVVITGLGQMTGGADGGGGNMSPRYGISITSIGSTPVYVTGGIAWGYSNGITGTAANFLATAVYQITGANYAYPN